MPGYVSVGLKAGIYTQTISYFPLPWHVLPDLALCLDAFLPSLPTLMLGKAEVRRRRGRQRVRCWMASLTQWTWVLSKLHEIVKHRGPWCIAVHGVAESRTRLSNSTAATHAFSKRTEEKHLTLLKVLLLGIHVCEIYKGWSVHCHEGRHPFWRFYEGSSIKSQITSARESLTFPKFWGSRQEATCSKLAVSITFDLGNNLTFLKMTKDLNLVQFSRVWLFATPWTAAYQASLSISISQSLLKFMLIDSVMPSNHLILCHPFLLLPSIFPIIRVFSNELAPCIRWPKYWSFSFSISPSMNQSFQWIFRTDFP